MANDLTRSTLPAPVMPNGGGVQDFAFPEQAAPAGAPASGQLATTEQVFDYLAVDQDPALVARLRHEWGAGAAAEIACGQALARDYPELVQIADRYDLDGNHPGILALAAKIARLSGYSAGAGGGRPAKPVAAMNTSERLSFEERVKDVRSRKQTALRNGDNRLADMLLEQEMSLYRAHGAADPIVGSGGRTA